jgi:hypothetical protein
MHIWELQIIGSKNEILLSCTVNPVGGTEGKDMVFLCPSGAWLESGLRTYIWIYKDGVKVAEGNVVPGSSVVTKGQKFGSWHYDVLANDWIRPAADTWELFIESKNQEELATVSLTISTGKIGEIAEFKFPTFHWKNSGQIGTFHYLKNGNPVARFVAYPETVVYGSVCPAGTVCVKPDEWLPDAATVKKEPVCDCGGWATYGKDANLHEDTRFFTCSLVKKV